jgi:protein PhnA
MDKLPDCPSCGSDLTYQSGALYMCPMCAHEWAPGAAASEAEAAGGFVVKDAFGTELADGDTVTLIKQLKVKGASAAIKVGTKVKNIRLVDSDHNISCKVPGFGAMGLKSEFVKKA